MCMCLQGCYRAGGDDANFVRPVSKSGNRTCDTVLAFLLQYRPHREAWRWIESSEWLLCSAQCISRAVLAPKHNEQKRRDLGENMSAVKHRRAFKEQQDTAEQQQCSHNGGERGPGKGIHLAQSQDQDGSGRDARAGWRCLLSRQVLLLIRWVTWRRNRRAQRLTGCLHRRGEAASRAHAALGKA